MIIFATSQSFYSLPVPGLAEKRPSVLIGEASLMYAVLISSHG